MWASTHRTAEWSDQRMNLSAKAKATAMKQGKLELNQVAQVAWTCCQDVEANGLPQLMWLDSPDWSPNAEGNDFSQALHLTETPLQWDPVRGQVSAVKIQLHTDTDTQTNDALWFQSTCAHSSCCWDSHSLGVQHHWRQPSLLWLLCWHQTPYCWSSLQLAPGSCDPHTHSGQRERLCRGRVRKRLNWKAGGAVGRAQRSTMATQFYTWPAS